MNTFADKILRYFFHGLPENFTRKNGISAINPYSDPETKRVCQLFFKKFFNDNNKRTALIGINPGRFGGGVTGIPFTDPVALTSSCSIENAFVPKRELSSRFVYDLIDHLGGPDIFYKQYYFATMFPLALIKGNKNHNYYDSRELFDSVRQDIIVNLKTQISFGLNTDKAVCLGKKNLDFLSEINEKEKLFKTLTWVEHPRYIQQYKLKQVSWYFQKYKEKLGI